LVTLHAYEIPEEGQVEEHVGCAVKTCWPPPVTVGVKGVMDTEASVTVVTVITVESPFVVAPSVAFTKMPTVPAVDPALNVSVDPEPERVPRAVLDRLQTYVMLPGHVALHAGVAVKSCEPVAPSVGAVGVRTTEFRVIGAEVTVIVVEDPLVVVLSVALT
jgi:hypothetical protein